MLSRKKIIKKRNKEKKKKRLIKPQFEGLDMEC